MRISGLLSPLKVLPTAPRITAAHLAPAQTAAFTQDQLRLSAGMKLQQASFTPLQLFNPPQSGISALSPNAGLEQAYRNEQIKIQQVGPLLSELPNFAITPLRIALEENVSSASFEIEQADLSVNGPEGEQLLGTNLHGSFEVQAREGGFVLFHNQQKWGEFQGRLQVKNHSDSMQINGQPYRGDLELMPHPLLTDQLQVINEILLEDYLKSVVPSESPASWPQESLKAQALAARTYAVSNWGKHAQNGFDMKDDTSDQMYKGLSSEHPNTNAAVAATAHEIMVFNQRPITALFFSTSGGFTDSAQEVWGVDLPYIQPRPDFDQAAPRYRWNLERSASDLKAASEKLGLNLGAIQDIIPLSKTPQGRVKTLRLVGQNGSADVDANKFRFAARLYSTLWQVKATGPANARQFDFSGGGWGHGLGMSQWGARQMAEDGNNAETIVKHYYQGIELSSLPIVSED